MKNKIPLLLSVLSLPVLLTGCASIIDGGSDKTVRLSSEPAGAKVTVTDKKGKAICVQTTPAIVPLRRRAQKYQLTFEHPGYYPATAKVNSIINGWYFGNILVGGTVGMIVDLGTGAAWTLHPRDIAINLVEVVSGDPLTPEQIKAAQKKANLTPRDREIEEYRAKHARRASK